MSSYNRFVNNPTTHSHPLTQEEKMDDNPLGSSLLWTIFKGAQTLTTDPSGLKKAGFHGTCLLAQLHQEWLKLWGLLNTTITQIKFMEGSVTVADSITVPLSPDLTVDCF